MATEPEFLRYSPDDIVTMGREQGLPPEEIAQGVKNHRNTLETWGRDNGGEQYFNGAVKLDNDTDKALGGLRLEMQRRELTRAMPNPVEQQKLAAELEKHAYDVSKLPEAFRSVVEKAMKVGQELSLPAERYYGAKVTAGGRDLANFTMRRAGDGMMDVGLTIPDPSDPMRESQALARVPHATAADVRAEIEKRQADLQEVERVRKMQGYAPDTPDVDTRSMAFRFYAAKGAELQQRIEDLQKGGPVALMNERVREELKKPEWRGKIGQYAGGAEFYKGLESAGISSAALFARAGQIVGAPGADKTMRDLGEIQSTQDLRLGGSTRRALEGGLLNDSIKSAQQSLGQMAPFMVGGMLTRAGLGAVPGEAAAGELAKQQAGRLGAAGAGMSASATGAAELETQRKIDDAVARGDAATAERLRAGRDLHALLTGVTEGAVERLGAGQTQNIFKGGVLNAGKELGKEGVEEVITGGIQRAVVDPVTLGERPDVFGPMPQELLSGIMAAGPIAGGGALANLNQRGTNDGLQGGEATGEAGTNAQGTGAAAGGGVAGGNPFAGPIQAPPQRDEAGNVMKPGPVVVPPFRDDPYGTLVRQPAGGNVLQDFNIPRTAEAQAAYEQRQQEYAQSQATAMGQMNRAGGRMPMIPDNPLGYRDILDFVNDNPLYIPTKGSEGAKAGEYDWTGQYEMPKYYRRFLASSEGGMRADQLAQMAFDEGYIAQPTPDALMEQIQKTIRERTQYKVEFRREQQAQKDEVRRVTAFDQAQQKASPVESTTLPLQAVRIGDEFTLAGENARVSQVEYDEDGNVTLVQIEDGKKFGVLNLNAQARGAILVDEYKPLPRGGGSGPVAPNAEDADPFMPAPPNRNVSAAAERAFELATGQRSELSPTLRRSMFADAPGGRAGGQPGQTSEARGVGKLFSMPEGSTAGTTMQVQNETGSGDVVTLGAGEKQVPQEAATSLDDVKRIVNASLSRAEVETLLKELNTDEVKDVVRSIGYPTTGTKADNIKRILSFVGSRADAIAIRGENPTIRNTPTIVRTPEQQAAFDEERRLETERARELDISIPKRKPTYDQEEWNRNMAAIMAPSSVPSAQIRSEIRAGTTMQVQNETGSGDPVTLTPEVLAGAYAAAAKGSSTQMVPIKRMYEEAVKLQPGLEVSKFLEAVKEADDSGAVMLEVYDKPQEVKDAGDFVLANASGIPAVRMMMTPMEEGGDLAMPANLQRPAVAGPLPSNYSGAVSPTMGTAPQPWSGRVQSLMGIRKYLLNAVGLPAVGVGRFKRALGIYRIKPQSVRLQAINDIPVLAHEIGHAIHYRVLSGNAAVAATWNGRHDAELNALGAATSLPNYTPAMVRKEGVAEFTRLWLTDPVQAWAQAPGFATFWQSEIQTLNPGMYEALQQSQRMIGDYVAMPEAQRGMSQIAFDPAALEIKATMGEWMRTAYAQMVDTLEPMLKVVRQAAEMNPKLETQAQDLVMWAENHRGGAASKTSADIFQSQTDLTGNVVGPGLQTILKDLQPGENRMFSYYLAIKRAQELERRGMRSGFENAHPPAAEMQAMEARFGATRLKLQTWMKNGKNLLVQAGLLDAASSKAMDDANQDYVPFYRLYEKLNGVSFGPEGTQGGGGYVDLNSGIKRIKGSDRAIVDPLQSVLKNAFMFRKLAEQNLIGQKFFDLVKEVHGHGMWGEEIAPKMQPTTIKHEEVVKKLKEEGIIQDASQLPANADLTLRLFQAMTKPDTKNGEVIIFRNGKRDHWQIKDPMLMQALKYADADAAKLNGIAGWFKAIFTVPKRVLTFGATGGPWFALPNIIRDTVQGGVMSTSKGKGATGFVPFYDTLRGGWNILRDKGAFEQWKQAGGEFSGMVSGTKAFTTLLEEALPKDPLAQRAMQGLASPAAWKTGLRNALDLVGAFGQFSERATRVGEFMRAKENGASDMAAANFSKTVSLNFARGGEMSRVLNQFIPFLNATIQGLDQFWQAHANPKTRTATILKGFTFITVPSLLCWALGKDDEEIQNLPDYRKNLFWNINLKPLAAAMGMPEKGFILSIPKPFLLGAVYGTSVERLLDYATGRDPNGATKAAQNILSNTMNPFDVMMSVGGIRPIIEARTNHSLFSGRDIVPEGYQNLPKEFQYSVLTSETAKTLGKYTGQSPMMIDHLLRGYFATAGKFGTDIVDYGMAKLALTDVPPSPRKGMMELPILNRFAGSPYQANAFVSRFYEASKDMEGKLSVLNKQSENLTTEEQKKWFTSNRDELGHYLRTVNAQTGRTGAGDVRAAQATLSELNAAMKTVQANRVLDPDVKRARMIELTQTRNKVAEAAFKTLFPEQVRIRHW